LELDSGDRFVSLIEKPETPVSNLAVPGQYPYEKRAVGLTEALAPLQRGKLKIADLNQAYLDRGELAVVRLGRSIAWLDSGTPESLHAGSELHWHHPRTLRIQDRLSEGIACRRSFITLDDLVDVAGAMSRTSHCAYLEQLAAVISAISTAWRP